MPRNRNVKCPYCSNRIAPSGMVNHFRSAHPREFNGNEETMRVKASETIKKAHKYLSQKRVECPVCLKSMLLSSIKKHYETQHPSREIPEDFHDARKKPGPGAKLIMDMKMIDGR